MQAKPKILLAISTLGCGGAERVMCNLANYWARRDIQVLLFIAMRGAHGVYELDPRVQVLCHDYRNRFLIERLYNKIRIFCIFVATVRRERPDSVLSFLTPNNFVNIFSKLFCSHKAYISIRNNPKIRTSAWENFIYRWIYPFADGIIAQTARAAEVIRGRTGNQNIRVIANPVSFDFSGAVNSYDQKQIISLGRLIPSKGFATLIDIFSKVHGDFPEWTLHIYGHGPLKGELLEQIRDLKMEGVIFLHDPSPEVPKLLLSSSIFASTSISEGFPNVLAEAAIMKRACICFDCDFGPSDIIEDGKNGFLIPMMNNELYREKLLCLMQDISLRKKFGENAGRLTEKLNSKVIADDFFSFILDRD